MSELENVSISDLILINAVSNESFIRECVPFIRADYFEDAADQEIFRVVQSYFNKTSNPIGKNIALIELNESKLNGDSLKEAKEKLGSLFQYKPEQDLQWLKEQAEQWCRDRAVYMAIVKSISIYDGTEKKIAPHAIPELLSEALGVSFNTNVGEDWQDDAEARYERYISPQNKIPFDIELLNDITLGGVKRKTLNMILAGVHVGKTFTLVHLAAAYVRLGYNVFYASFEMDEDDILMRVDANMLKTSTHLISSLGKETFLNKINKLKEKSYGKLKVIQYPTSSAHCGHVEMSLNELRLKKKWVPDVVMFDYLGCVASYRMVLGQNSNPYLKSVAEEIRALSKKMEFAAWSAHQLNRTGMNSSDVELTDIAESIGITGVADLIWAGTRNEEMDALGQIHFKQLKNRYRPLGFKPKFILGSNFDCQTLMGLSENYQNSITEEMTCVDINTGEIQKRFEANLRRRKLKLDME